MTDRERILDEARKQTAALATIGRWRSWLFGLTAALAVLTAFGLRGNGARFVTGVVSAVLTALSFIALLLVDLSIRNGHRNVERMLDLLR